MEITRQYEEFASLTVAKDDATVVIDLGLDWWENKPAIVDVGPVLSLKDSVASKLLAVYSRGYARDYLDAYSILSSKRFTRSEVSRSQACATMFRCTARTSIQPFRAFVVPKMISCSERRSGRGTASFLGVTRWLGDRRRLLSRPASQAGHRVCIRKRLCGRKPSQGNGTRSLSAKLKAPGASDAATRPAAKRSASCSRSTAT